MRCAVVFLWCLSTIFAQNCDTPGESCNDDKDCCGGCCIRGKCILTQENCQEVTYPCLENYCGPGFECYMYQPGPDCIGCEPQNDCRPFKDPGSGHY